MDSWIFILYFVQLSINSTNYVAQIIPALAIGSSFYWLLCPSDVPLLLHVCVTFCLFTLLCFVFEPILAFQHYKMLQAQLGYSMSHPSLETAISSRNPLPFYWRTILGTKNSFQLNVLNVTKESFFQAFPANRANKYICINTYLHVRNHTCMWPFASKLS